VSGGQLEIKAHANVDPITIVGTGSIIAGDIVIAGAGKLGSSTVNLEITANSVEAAAVNGILTLTGATKITAGGADGVILSVDDGESESAHTAVFTSAASNGLLAITTTSSAATINLDNSTGVDAAITLTAYAKLAIGSAGIVKVASATSTIKSAATGTLQKLTFAQGAKVSFAGDTTGTSSLTVATGVLAKGTFASAKAFTGKNDDAFWTE
jgi:hypothetical protein